MKWWYIILVFCAGCSNDASEYKNSRAHEADMEVLDFYRNSVQKIQNIIRSELRNKGESSDSLFVIISRINFAEHLERFDMLINPDSLDKDAFLVEARELLKCATKENLDTTGLKKGLEILSSADSEDDLLMTANTFLTNARFNYLNDLKTELKKVESDVWPADKVSYWIQEDKNVIHRDSVYKAKILVFNEFGPNDKLIEKFFVNDSVINGHKIVLYPNSSLHPNILVFSKTEIQSINLDSDPLISRSKFEIKYEDCVE